ncbi:MAG: acyl-CoA ligase (AMP-forming), exosortase A system-associated [Burkholderiales bacterium]
MKSDPSLLHGLLFSTASAYGSRPALTYAGETLSYDELANQTHRIAAALVALGLERSARVGIYLEKRFEMVISCFGAAAAGGVFVPINPILKPDQVAYIMRDCNVRVLITSPERRSVLADALPLCPDLRHVVVTGTAPTSVAVTTHAWSDLISNKSDRVHRAIDTDMLAILYTSGSTGKPKGVVLSHRNMVAGARSVAQYLENVPDDSLVAALPLSFDAGFSQLTTAFSVGARVVLLNYLMPRDVVNTLVKERITGITAVPPLYIQMSQLEWPATVTDHLRYFANTGGRMPFETLKRLRTLLPRTKPFLMYGLTEAFRSTYLPPEEVDRRPDSIGKAIPNAEILVLREDGTHCAPDESGELVHRGALVGMGYWNDPEKTAERYKPVPGREAGLVFPEMAVFSGDNVRMDEDGFLYFIGRRDEMIKTSGYRVSPTEIEEVLYATQMVGELAAFGVSHPTLGQAIVVIATPKPGESLDGAALLTACRDHLPAYMIPARIDVRDGPLPRNPNGKIDRKLLSGEYQDMFEKVST